MAEEFRCVGEGGGVLRKAFGVGGADLSEFSFATAQADSEHCPQEETILRTAEPCDTDWTRAALFLSA